MGKKVHLAVTVDPAQEAHIRQLLLKEGAMVKAAAVPKPKQAAAKPETAAKAAPPAFKAKTEAKQSKPKKEKKSFRWEDFSFAKSRALSADFKGSFSDAIIEERREGN